MITISETSTRLSVYSESKSYYKDPSDYNRLKGYLRNNGFEADGFGTQTRYLNDSGKICTGLEQMKENYYN